MRRHVLFDVGSESCVGTLDKADGTTGLLIVSGGNEIRSGAHAGQAAMAAHLAAKGHPVFRYDRRGIGDSEGENSGFVGSAEDIAAALSAFRREAPQLEHIAAFGNCDAATALALFSGNLEIDALILANPWVIDSEDTGSDNDAPTPPSAASVRARYWARLKNPRSIIDLLAGKIDLKKLAGGLARAAQKDTPSQLAGRLAEALAEDHRRIHILLAQGDATAQAFEAAWNSDLFVSTRSLESMTIDRIDSGSHSFADSVAREWLYARIEHVILRMVG